MCHILALDDEVEITDWIREVFEGEGYRVTAMNDPEEALLECRQNRFDVIISDICMPKMNGVEVIRKIRKGINADTPVIVLTGSPDHETAQWIVELKPFAYLDKPFDLNVLMETVHQAVHHRSGK